MRHDVLNVLVPDNGSEHLWHGYPDECFSFSSFADSPVALILYGEWGIQPPITVVRKAIIVDFASDRQAQAEVSLGHGWNGAWEFPMGVANTVHSRLETNEQNAKICRHLSVIGTAMTNEDFFRAVGEKLLDVHSCHIKSCKICSGRMRRGLADVCQILSSGMKESEVHLFAKWTPSDDLVELLRSDGITLVAHPLARIPSRAIEANRCYHIWDGTEQQGHEFREAIWAPSWMEASDMPLQQAITRKDDSDTSIAKRAGRSWTKDLVYGDVLGNLVFLTRTRATDLVEVQRIVRTRPTWGEFRRSVSLRIRTETDRWFDSDSAASDDEPFEAPEDWPFPAQEQIEWLPKDVVTLGRIVDTVLSGEKLDFPHAAEAEIVKRLLRHGYEVERDDDLVKRACDEIE
jgi:hypothetical protein